MGKPTEELKEEHEAIKLMLQILEAIIKKIERREDVPEEHLEKVLDFIKVFADKCHHGKEEDLLFPVMEQAGVPGEEGPIGAMLAEHDTGRSYVRRMGKAVSGKKHRKFAENARAYTQLLEQHIEKENNILYPMADARLSEHKQEELLKGFEKIEKERVGEGKHEEFHELLHRLKEVYL